MTQRARDGGCDQEISKGNRIYVIRGKDWDVDSGVVTSSFCGADGMVYRVRWGSGAWSGISTFGWRDVFKNEAAACIELATRMAARSTELLKRAGQEPINCEPVAACRHGIED